jgi:uncharacterized protein YjbJ (UPF0337 family)
MGSYAAPGKHRSSGSTRKHGLKKFAAGLEPAGAVAACFRCSANGGSIKGYANQAVGKAKEKIGQVTGSGKTETQGNVQSIKGKAQVATGKVKDTILADSVKKPLD